MPFFKELPRNSKKLVLVLATSVPMIDNSKEVIVKIPCIYYLVQFKEEQKQIRVLLDNGSKVNIRNPVFAWKLGFYIQKTNVGAQKIDGSAFETFGIVITNFQVENKVGKYKFF